MASGDIPATFWTFPGVPKFVASPWFIMTTSIAMVAFAVLAVRLWRWANVRQAQVRGIDVSFLHELQEAFEAEELHGSHESDVNVKLQACLRDLKLRPSFGLLDEFVKVSRRAALRGNESNVDPVLFGEFALFVAKLKVFRQSYYRTREELIVGRKAQTTFAPPPKHGVQVFLGGSCNPTTWRRDVAIPKLKAMDVTYYNPQIDNWTPELIEVEEIAKKYAQIKFFVIDKMTRGISSMVEIAYLAATQCELMVVLEDFDEESVFDGQPVLPVELVELNRGHDILCTFLFEKGIPLFDDIDTALDYTVNLVTQSQSIKHLEGDLYVAEPVIRGTDLSILSEARSTFDQYDSDETGFLSIHDLQLAVRTLTGVGISETDLEEALDACSGSPRPIGHAAKFPCDNRCGSDSTSSPCRCESGLRQGSSMSDQKVSRSDFYAVVASLVNSQHQDAAANRWQRAMRSIDLFPEPEPDMTSVRRGVFLGGSMSERWREDAIPLLMQHGVDYFNPTILEVCGQLMPREAQAKRSCHVLLFFVSRNSRDISTMVEAAHFLGEGRDVVLCLESVEPDTLVDNELITPRAAKDINRGRHYLADVANRESAPVFTDIVSAVNKAITMVQSKRRARVDLLPTGNEPKNYHGSLASRAGRNKRVVYE